MTLPGEKDAIRVNVHDVTDATSHDDVLLFGTALIGSPNTTWKTRSWRHGKRHRQAWTGAVDLRRCHRQRQSCQGRHRVPTKSSASTMTPIKDDTSALDAALENLSDISK